MTDAPIQIRNPDVVRDIRALADRLGLPMTDVVADAVRRRLAEEMAKASEAQGAAQRRVADVLARIDALAITGPKLTDDDLYGPDGLPRQWLSTPPRCWRSILGNQSAQRSGTP